MIRRVNCGEKIMGYRKLAWQELKTETLNKAFKNFCHAKEKENIPEIGSKPQVSGGCVGSIKVDVNRSQ